MFSAKSAKSATLLVNKDVDREEALAGIALLNKHEQAMKRYEGAGGNTKNSATSSADYYTKASHGIKPDWNNSTHSK